MPSRLHHSSRFALQAGKSMLLETSLKFATLLSWDLPVMAGNKKPPSIAEDGENPWYHLD